MVGQLYTEQREVYARYARESFSWGFIERPALDRHLAEILISGVKVVDAGCGIGRTIQYLLEKGVSGNNILGIDINLDMIEETRLLTSDVRLVSADIEQLPLASNSQELVICSHVLHYFDNPKYLATMKEFRRVLKPAGVLLVIITHPMRTARNDLREYFNRRWIMDRTPWGTESPLYFRPVSDLVNLALEAGLKLDNFDEIEVDPAGRQNNEYDYDRYSACPPRLALRFRK